MTVDQAQSLDVYYNTGVIAFTLLAHEYCLTFRAEVERFWNSPFLTWPNVFFHLNRYLTLLGHIPVIFSYFWVSPDFGKSKVSTGVTAHTCSRLRHYHHVLVILIQFLVAVLLVIRTYALYDRSRKVLLFCAPMFVGGISVGVWLAFSQNMPSEPDSVLSLSMGCMPSLPKEAATKFGIAWTVMLVFDVLIFSLTLFKSVPLRHAAGLSLLTLLLRDGSVYFGVMILINLGNILTFFYGDAFTRGAGTTLMNVTSSIMITRLMLNLRDPEFSLLTLQTTQHCTTIAFHHSQSLGQTLISHPSSIPSCEDIDESPDEPAAPDASSLV